VKPVLAALVLWAAPCWSSDLKGVPVIGGSGRIGGPLFSLPAVPQRTYAAIITADGATYYWRLGESSGTNMKAEIGGRDGTYANTPTLGATGALSGDADTAVTWAAASTQYAELATGTWTLVDYTLELWVKFTTSAYARLLNFQDICTGGPDPFVIMRTSDGAGGAGTKFTFQSTGSSVTTDGTYGDGAWHHFVVTRQKGGTNLIYVDGTEVKTGGDGNSVHTRTGLGAVAGFCGGSGEHFTGTLDEIAVYEGVILTPTQIAAHHDCGANGNCP